MAGIKHLREIYEKRGDEFLTSLLNHHVIINEKMDGAYFGAQKEQNNTFRCFKRNGELSYIDRVLMNYYNPAIDHFESLSKEIRDEIPHNYRFGMEFFTRKDVLSIDYDRLPKNNLILSYIHVIDESGKTVKTIQCKDELNKWADLLMIERPPIVFEGKLNDEQKEQILDFIYLPLEEAVDKYKVKSFTKHIINVLNPKMKATFLRESLDKDIEGLVFRFYNENEANPNKRVFLAKMVDPLFEQKMKEKASKRDRKADDYLWLIVIDLMNHIESYNPSDLSNFKFNKENPSKRYIELVNHIFKGFIDANGKKYKGVDLNTPEFLQSQDFDVNYDLVGDESVIDIIKTDDNYKEIYRVLLNFFRKKRSRTTAKFFTPSLMKQLNNQVEKIRRITYNESLYESEFPSFKEFLGNGGDLYGSLDEYEEKGAPIKSRKANIMVGRFQPIHLGHIKSAQELKSKNGLPVVFVVVKGNKPNKKSPIQKATIMQMMNKVKNEYPDLIAEVVFAKTGFIENILKAIRPNFEPVHWGCGADRFKDYQLQLDYIKRKNLNLNLKKDFKLVELPRFGSATDVRNAIENEDFAGFKKLTPTSIHSHFYNLKKELENFKTAKQAVFEKKTKIDPLLGGIKHEYIHSTGGGKGKIENKLENTLNYSKVAAIIEKLEASIAARGFSKDDSDRFINGLIQIPDVSADAVVEYINFITESGLETDGDFDLTKSWDESMNFMQVLQEKHNIDPRITEYALGFQHTTGSTKAGQTEFCLTMLFKEAKTPTIGDLSISGIKYEVKANSGALMGMKSGKNYFSPGAASIDETIKYICSCLPVNEATEIKNIVPVNESKNEWNLTKDGIKNWNTALTYLYENGHDDVEISKIVSGLFLGHGDDKQKKGGVWSVMEEDYPDLAALVEATVLNHIKEGKIVDVNELKSKLAYVNLLYYSRIDEFDGLFVADTKTKSRMGHVAYLKIRENNEEVLKYDEFKRVIAVSTAPNWLDSYSSNHFKIRLSSKK